MIIERVKKLKEDKLNKEAERRKYNKHFAVLHEISNYFEDHPTENKLSVLNIDNFDEEYAMSLDIGRPYIIKKLCGRYGEYLEVTYREEYMPELYY